MTLLLITTLLIVFWGIGFYNAKKLQHITIKKTVKIKATTQTTFDCVLYLKNFKNWSPFYEADPSQKTKITGNDGHVGAQFHWNGNNGKDIGYQEIKKIEPLQCIVMECDIQKPFKANPTFTYTFTNSNNQTIVTQEFTLTSGLVNAFFMWLFGVKKDMEKMNARGMELLKIVCEQQ